MREVKAVVQPRRNDRVFWPHSVEKAFGRGRAASVMPELQNVGCESATERIDHSCFAFDLRIPSQKQSSPPVRNREHNRSIVDRAIALDRLIRRNNGHRDVADLKRAWRAHPHRRSIGDGLHQCACTVAKIAIPPDFAHRNRLEQCFETAHVIRMGMRKDQPIQRPDTSLSKKRNHDPFDGAPPVGRSGIDQHRPSIRKLENRRIPLPDRQEGDHQPAGRREGWADNQHQERNRSDPSQPESVPPPR